MKPIVYQAVTDFRGTKQDQGILTLRDVWSPAGTKNVWMDKVGRVRKVDGQTALAVTSTAYQVDASTAYVRSMTTLYHPGTQDWFLIGLFQKNDTTKDIAYGEIGTATSMTKADDADFAQHMDSAELDQILYLAFGNNGGDEPPKTATTDGTTVTVADAGGTQSPTLSVASGGGAGLSGTYEWKIVSVEADGSRHPGSPASTEIQLTDDSCDLTWTADSDTNVVGYELYRTTGTGKVFRFVDYIDVRTTAAYTDSLTDEELLNNEYLVSHGEAPPDGVYWVEQWRQRIWWARTATNPTRIWWSDPGVGDSCDLSRNYLDLSEVDASATEIMGIRVLEDVLYVSTRSAIWRISGTGEISQGVPDWLFRKTSALAGWSTTFAVATLPAGAILTTPTGEVVTNRDALAYPTFRGDIRAFDGTSEYVISEPVKDELGSGAALQSPQCHALLDDDRGQVYFFIPTLNKNFIYSYRYGLWSLLDTGKFSCSALIPEVGGAGTTQYLLTGLPSGGTGKVYEFFLGVDTASASGIDARFWTKPIYGTDEDGAPLAHLRKRWRSVDSFFDRTSAGAGTQAVDVHWYEGHADPDQSPTAHGTVTVTIADPSVTNEAYTQSFDRLQDSTNGYLHSEAVVFQIEEAGAFGPWALEGFILGYQVSERVRDR